MLTELILFFILIIGSVFLANIFKRKYEETLIVWILGIVFILYVFGLINILKYGVYFVLVLTFLMLIYNIIYFIKSKDKKEELKKLISPGMVTYFVMYLILCFIHRGRLLVNWDEFSHWGDSVKVMYTLNDFITSPLSNSTFKSYPPSMALFQYFVEVINRNFNEGILYLSYQIVGIALFLPLFKNLKWKNLSQITAAVILMTIIPIIFNNNYYTTIYIDSMLGITFGIIFIQIIFIKKFDIFEILKLSLEISFLINLKEVGIFLALILLVSIFFKCLNLNKNSKKLLKKYIPLFILIGAVIFTKVTWNYELKLNDVLLSNINIPDVLKVIFGFDSSYRQVVKVNFIKAIITEPILTEFVEFSTLKMSILITALFILFIKNDKENKFQFLLMLVGLVIYLIGLFIIYCYKFSEYEAINLASFSRYLSIYLIGVLVFLSINIFYKYDKKYLWILIIILTLYTPFLNLVNIFKKDYLISRESYITSANYIKSHVKENNKIYIVSQNSNGYDYWVLRFSLRPIIVDQGIGWSLGTPYYNGDIWTKDISPSLLMENLTNGNYDYLYCYNCDEQFKNTYGELFEDKEDISSRNLYKVDKEDKCLKLVK